MPPNHYGYTIPAQHGATKPALELLISQRDNWESGYYRNIGSAAGTIINFYNTEDAALGAWEFNQLTKPDVLAGPTWHYDWDWECPYSAMECALRFFPDDELGEKVTDEYTRDGADLTWTPRTPITEESAQILAHIIPSRSGALGQGAEGGLVIDGNVVFNYGASNQGHSAQFYSNFVERRDYWDTLLDEFDLE